MRLTCLTPLLLLLLVCETLLCSTVHIPNKYTIFLRQFFIVCIKLGKHIENFKVNYLIGDNVRLMLVDEYLAFGCEEIPDVPVGRDGDSGEMDLIVRPF